MTDQQHPDDEAIPHDPASSEPADQAAPPTYTAERVDEAQPSPPPPRRRRFPLAPLVLVLGAAVIGLAVLVLIRAPSPQSPPPSAEVNQRAALQNQVRTLTAQVQQLESRPAGDPDRLAALSRRVDALAHALTPAAAPDLAPVEQRLNALEQRVAEQPKPAPAPQVDLQPIDQRLSALEKQVTSLDSATRQQAASAATAGALTERVGNLAQAVPAIQQQLFKLSDTQQGLAQAQQHFASEQQRLADDQRQLAGKQQQLADELAKAGSNQAALKALSDRLKQQETALGEVRADVQKVASSAAKAGRVARVGAALASLGAGRPVGNLPDAPPAVARFASKAPPTVEELRAQFPDVAKAVLAASQPTAGKKFLDRLWTNAQDLVTVRQGDKVLVGDPAAGLLARAQDDLNHNDLADAVKAVSQLKDAAAQAASDWLNSARALLDARSALLGMTGAA